MKVHRVPVLIVGAGYAGLTAALLLGWRGIGSLVVERRSAPCRHPRAHGINRRTMEVLRIVEGLEQDLFAASRGGPNDMTVVISQTVTGPPLRTIATKAALDASTLSPAQVCSAGQDRVEPVLLRYARFHGADIRFSTRLVKFEETSQEIQAELRDEQTGETFLVVADYLIAGDGAHSGVRQALGIDMKGPGVLTHAVSILFEADLPAILGDGGLRLHYLKNVAFTGAFVTCDDPRFGQLNVEYDPEKENSADFDAGRCAKLVTIALGAPAVDLKIHDVIPWEMAAAVATRFASGRVFLAGDAAHLVPPVGGLGGQTAIQDAADLAWKLALVLKGSARPELLKTYEAERLPVAHVVMARQIANYVERMRPDREEIRLRSNEVDFLNAAMGYRYRSTAIISEDDVGPMTESPHMPSVAPGFRLPHVVLNRNGKQFSLHDLIGRDFVVVAGQEASVWASAAECLASNYPLTVYRIGDDFGSFCDVHAALRLSPQGAILIRPDGFVAWRTQEVCRNPKTRLGAALTRIFSRSDGADFADHVSLGEEA